MHICLLAEDFPTARRQSFVFVEQLVRALSDLGVKVTVIAPHSITKRIVRHEKRGFYHEVRKTKAGNTYNIYRPLFFSAGRIKGLQRVVTKSRYAAIKRVLSKIGCDVNVLYGHFWHMALALLPFSIKYNKPLFVACGEGDNALEELVTSLSAERKSEFAAHVTGVISVSTENKRKCIEYGLVTEDKIIVLPNGVDKTVFHPHDRTQCRMALGVEDNDFVVAFVGGFIPRKGNERVAQAIKEINNPHLKSVFIGRTFGGETYKPDCDGAVFVGEVQHDDLPKFLSAADIFVLPTLKEGCCNAIVEALAFGLPVVSSNGAFNDDILDEKCSIRVDPMSVPQIKAAIETLMDNAERRSSMAAGALDKSTELSIVSRAHKVKAFIEDKSLNK